MATRSASLPPLPSVALKYSASAHLRVRSMHFYAADYLFPFPLLLSLFSLHPPSLMDYGFTAVTRLPRSLSPVQGMQNKSGPFSARLPSAIVFFPLPPPPIVKYQRFSFSPLSCFSLSSFSREKMWKTRERREGREAIVARRSFEN